MSENRFQNNAFYCIGTGRMGLALQKQYYDQLKYVQDEIGFTHIRGHGLFCEDMAIYNEYTDKDGSIKSEYNFTYLDMVMDSYKELGLKPFLELGFMPKKMASGTQTVFYWAGNVTPPADYSKWTALVQATLRHLMSRYGKDEVTSWPVEVWNEPNMTSFWKDADMKKYFKLYKLTSRAVKEVDRNFRVGGPAVCGGSDKEWITGFLDFVKKEKCPLDFITRHHYTSFPPERDGHYGYINAHAAENAVGPLEVTRTIVDSYPEFRNMEIHVTEFNTSYIPNCPIHDTNLNAAYVALLLSKMGKKHASYSYWTFGDIFEEAGVPFTPFHGGFGLVANGLIPKPTFWTFVFFKKLDGVIISQSDDSIVVKADNSSYRAVIWNIDEKNSGKTLKKHFSLPTENGDYCLLTKTVDEECCNPLKMWHDMGECANPSLEQIKLLKDSAKPLVYTERLSSQKPEIAFDIDLKKNGICYVELRKSPLTSDRGYSYTRATSTLCKPELS